MAKFIIGYGRRSEIDVIEVADLDAALMEATRLSMLDGLLDDDLADTTFAEPYTDDLAWEYGLLDAPAVRHPFRMAVPW